MHAYLEILAITHHPDRTLPLTVEFKTGDGLHTLEANASQIQSFAAFQQFAMDSLGVWIRHESEVGGENAMDDWAHAVSVGVERAIERAAE